jgi:hypothetical protein
VDEGSYEGVDLADLNFSVYANWPGAIHEGNTGQYTAVGPFDYAGP